MDDDYGYDTDMMDPAVVDDEVRGGGHDDAATATTTPGTAISSLQRTPSLASSTRKSMT